MKKYYVGNFRDDALAGEHRNWIVGTFMEAGPRNTKTLEVKYWEYPVGDSKHREKISTTYECTILLEGEVHGVVDGVQVQLRAGQYITIPPGVTNNLVGQVLQPAKGFTVKAPSDPAAKRLVS